MAISDNERPEGEEPELDNGGADNPPFDGEDNPFAEEDARENVEELGETAQLELGDEDARLPWLEGDDEDEEQTGGGGQLAVLLIASLVALALIGGGIWWATRATPDGDLVADGGVIEAPDQPYKERPEDPGGKTFDGTGDSRFAVSEGKDPAIQLGGEDQGPKPGFETVDPAKAQGDAATQEAQPAQTRSGPGVQVGAYSSREKAEEGWRTLQTQYSALSGLSHRVVEGQADIGTVYRLQAVSGSQSDAQALCGKLKSAGLACYVKP